MDTDGRRVRSRRSRPASAQPHRATSSIAVTGAAAPIGAAIVRGLRSRPEWSVTAIDAQRGDADAEWLVGDVRDPDFARRVCDSDVVVHAEAVRRSAGRADRAARPVVRAAQAVLTAAAAGSTQHVIVMSSAQVYGASPDHPVPLPEDFPLLPFSDDPVLDDLLELEALAARALTVGSRPLVTVLRPAVLVAPGLDTLLYRYFDAPRLLVPRDGRPCWQFCHVDDVVSAIVAVVEHQVGGPVTVACEGWLETQDVERVTGTRRLELPVGLAFSTAERLHRLGVTSAPASELAYTLHPWVVDATRLRAVGWTPGWGNEDVLRALLREERGRGTRRRDAAIGAAGATVAVIGTAALVRAARRRSSSS
jgi:nucleoside-diphosphate-sugar epimerase